MAMYVYKDASRTKKLLARDAQKQDKGTRFYCPNPQCDAHMYIWSLDGVSASYFGASRSHGHMKGCAYYSLNEFNPNKYNEDKFEFENALSALTMPTNPQTKNETPGDHGIGSVTPKPLHTLFQIYSMCKAEDCSGTYNGITIGQMLLDNRSFYMYPKGVFGWRIIEGKCRKPYFYDSTKKEIYLTVSTDSEEYTFTLKFDDEDLFKEIKNDIFPNREYLIIVAGKWGNSGIFNVFCSAFSSTKQLKIIK